MICTPAGFSFEKKMKATGSNSWRFVANQTITMGTATSAGEIETGTSSGKGMRFTNVNKTYKFEAANPESFPWVGTDGGAGWNNGETGNTIELKGCDMQFDLNTQGSGGDEPVTWKLTGDCEFDAFTVDSGDTLDLNGQRMECSGLLDNNGTIDVDGALIYAEDLNLDGDYEGESGLIGVVVTGATNIDIGDAELTSGTFMINSDGTCTCGGRTCSRRSAK